MGASMDVSFGEVWDSFDKIPAAGEVFQEFSDLPGMEKAKVFGLTILGLFGAIVGAPVAFALATRYFVLKKEKRIENAKNILNEAGQSSKNVLGARLLSRVIDNNYQLLLGTLQQHSGLVSLVPDRAVKSLCDQFKDNGTITLAGIPVNSDKIKTVYESLHDQEFRGQENQFEQEMDRIAELAPVWLEHLDQVATILVEGRNTSTKRANALIALAEQHLPPQKS